MADVVQKLWGFCHTLRHDGIDYGDYIEQITYLLFIKMADERGVDLPGDTDWPSLSERTGTGLLDLYVDVLRKLGKQPGILGDIFAGAISRFNNPVNLKRLISLTIERRVTTGKQRPDKLTQAVLAKAFRGELVPTEAELARREGRSYEPASALLERIKAECQTQEPSAKRKRRLSTATGRRRR